jgi:cation transport regulator ChaC
MNRLLWALVRPLIYLRRGRIPPASLDGPIWYFAYGSNMNERLFRDQRHMVWQDARVGRLDGYRLVFSRAGGRHPGQSAPANIVEDPSGAVHGVLYLLPLRKFARLDNSEGRQYVYLWVDVEDAEGNRIPAVTYKVPGVVPEGRPSRVYLDLVRDAARQRGLPADHVALLERTETSASSSPVSSRSRCCSSWYPIPPGVSAPG